MPRRTLEKTEESIALDQAARAFAQLADKLEAQRRILHRACVAAVKSGMSKSEVARRAGYTREYVAALVNNAEEPPKPAE